VAHQLALIVQCHILAREVSRSLLVSGERVCVARDRGGRSVENRIYDMVCRTKCGTRGELVGSSHLSPASAEDIEERQVCAWAAADRRARDGGVRIQMRAREW